MIRCGVLACFRSVVIDSQYLNECMPVFKHSLIETGEAKSRDKIENEKRDSDVVR